MVIRPWSKWSTLLCSLHQNKSVCSLELSGDVGSTIVIPHIDSLNTWRWKEISLTSANALPKTTVCTVAPHNRMSCHWLCAFCCLTAIGWPFTFIWRILVFTPSFHQSLPCMDVCSPYWFLLSPYAESDLSSEGALQFEHLSQSRMKCVKVGLQTD